jgi:hypothetical protein
MLFRQGRNVEEHEQLKQYLRQCNRSRKAEFFDLINFHHLNGLLKYKEVEMKTLEKVFVHYLKCNEYY